MALEGPTHLLVVFDFVLLDGAVSLARLLPGQLDAALLHGFLDELADLGRSCGKKTEMSKRQQHDGIKVSSFNSSTNNSAS